MMNIDIKNFTEDELVKLQCSISNELNQRKKERYNKLKDNFLQALKILSKEFPWDEAFVFNYSCNDDDSIDWEELNSWFN